MSEFYFVSADRIFPTNSGGRLELRNEYEALLEAGHSVAGIFPYQRREGIPSPGDLGLEYGPNSLFFPRRGLVRATLRFPTQPYMASSRMPAEKRLNEWLPEWNASAIVASHEWALPTAQWLQHRTGAPIILRSHNVERRYVESLLDAASSRIRRAYYQLELSRMAALEEFYLNVNGVLAISSDDAEFYEQRGMRVYEAPPILLRQSAPQQESVSPRHRHHALFVGALDLPHAQQDLRWLVDEVWPHTFGQAGDHRLLVAGRGAPPALVRELQTSAGVMYLGEVENLSSLYETSRVFLNPSRSGSGVNMRMGGPAHHGLPIVSTNFGLRGFREWRVAVPTADSAAEFARWTLAFMQDDTLWEKTSSALKSTVQKYTGARFVQTLCEAVHHASP